MIIPIQPNGNPMSSSATIVVPRSRLGKITNIIGMGPFENQNVTRVWEALKNSSYTIDSAITYGQIEQKVFGNDPGRIRNKLSKIRSSKKGRSICGIFMGEKTKEEYQLEEQLRSYEVLVHAAIRAFSRHLRKVGTHILAFTDQNGERRYTIIMDDETIEFAIAIHKDRIRTEQSDNNMLNKILI